MKKNRNSCLAILIAAILAVLSSCRSSPPPQPTLPSTDTQILDMMVEAVEGIDYGFAPLLTDPAAQVVFLPSPAGGRARPEHGRRGAGGEGETAYLTYPTQPADPLEWPAMDCFTFAYAVRRHLLSEFPGAVKDIALALVEIPSGIGQDYSDLTARHVYARVRFADGHTAALDLTPLAADPVNPRHIPVMLVDHAAGLESQFEAWRRRVPLRQAQPMLTVERGGRLYTLLAAVNVLPGELQFTLRAYETQPARAGQSLRYTRGALVGLRFDRDGFSRARAALEAGGPSALGRRQDLLVRRGDPDPTLAAVLDDHLALLWHLVTKTQATNDET